MTDHPTASGLDRGMECVGPDVLSHVDVTNDDNSYGEEVHEYLDRAHEIGRDGALAELMDPIVRLRFEKIDLEALPPGADSELTVAYDPETDIGRVLGRKLKRDYRAALPSEYVGTADRIGRKPGVLIGGDFKTGNRYKPAKESWQARLLSLAGARAIGADEAEFTMLYLDRNGRWTPDRAEFSALDFADYRDQLRERTARRDAARAQLATGKMPKLHAGPWCRYCPSIPYCPEQTRLARALIPELEGIEEKLPQLKIDEAAAAWERLDMIGVILDRVRGALKSRATIEHIPLRSGDIVRETSWGERVVDGKVALRVLREDAGDEVADAAYSVTLASIERAFAQAGRSAREARQAIRSITAAGGIVQTHSRQVRAVKK